MPERLVFAEGIAQETTLCCDFILLSGDCQVRVIRPECLIDDAGDVAAWFLRVEAMLATKRERAFSIPQLTTLKTAICHGHRNQLHRMRRKEIMKRSTFVLVLVALLAVAIAGFAQDLSSVKGTIVAPPSTLDRTPGKVHTPLYIFYPADKTTGAIPSGETPASIACIDGVVPPTNGCPKNGNVVPTGGAKAIAVVEYGTYANVQSDLNTFSTQFGLPQTTIVALCAAPPCPNNVGSGWDLEEALDVEYAHAMAPHATIIVESFTNDPLGDGAEQQAAQYISTNFGAGEISNSWTYNGGENWCGSGNCELQYDQDFAQPGIVYFASTGDSGYGVAYPAVSINVVAAGGTFIQRDSNGNYTGQSCWSGAGGGISQYEAAPQYQLLLAIKNGGKRGIPDWASDASPASGVDIYSSTYCGGWCTVGGTSVSSPTLAGIVNDSGQFKNNTPLELGMTYGYYWYLAEYFTYYYDVTTGSNGHPATTGWDTCTGLGAPRKASGF
jgi:kumamolisin